MRLGLRRLLTTMSAMENKGPSMLASPKTQDPLFRRIEDVHHSLNKPYGRILDAGTGGHSLKWLATLPDEAVDCITAVTADATSGEGKGASDKQSLLNTGRGDALVEGSWCSGHAPAGAAFDTVLCDYLIGSMDGFTPFMQDTILSELKARCAPGALLHVVGLTPIYAQLGAAQYKNLKEAERIVVDTARLRDACILLAAHRPYREFPATWIIRQLEKSGFEVITPWKSYGVIWKHATIKRQLDVARRKLPHFADQSVAAAMRGQIDALDASAKKLLGATGVTYGADYVISARLPPASGE